MQSSNTTERLNGFRSRKVGLIGVGNLGQAIIKSLVTSGTVPPENFFATNRTPRKLQKAVEDFQIQALPNNEELIEKVDVVILGVKPQDLYEVLEPLSSSFSPHQTVVSLAAGVEISALKKVLPNVTQFVRWMPNSAVRLGKGVVGYCLADAAIPMEPYIQSLIEPLGFAVKVAEGDEFEALTVSSASGVGFVFELMVYWQEWLEEHGISPETARAITVKTFLGSALLAEENPQTEIGELQNKVTSKKGVTAAGLDSMRELEVERLLRYSFEKAALRDKELGEAF